MLVLNKSDLGLGTEKLFLELVQWDWLLKRVVSGTLGLKFQVHSVFALFVGRDHKGLVTGPSMSRVQIFKMCFATAVPSIDA